MGCKQKIDYSDVCDGNDDNPNNPCTKCFWGVFPIGCMKGEDDCQNTK